MSINRAHYETIYVHGSTSSILQFEFNTTVASLYEVLVVKRTEAFCGDAYGIVTWSSVTVDGGDVTTRSETSSKKMLVIGDSYPGYRY